MDGNLFTEGGFFAINPICEADACCKFRQDNVKRCLTGLLHPDMLPRFKLPSSVGRRRDLTASRIQVV